ncbi:MAG: hypothetical protein HY909_01285 [Deltaproteobacteria bacterium]|nr:hypothetical protein [Deltaproteobacteria bacterium]
MTSFSRCLSLALTLLACSSSTSQDTADSGADAAEGATPDTTTADSTLPDLTAPDTTLQDTTLPDISRPDTTSTDTARDGTPPTDGTRPCPMEFVVCVSGTPGGACGDAALMAMCVDGAWRCPPGTIRASECACVGRPPGAGCVCESGGWRCPDAGAPDAPRPDAGGSCAGAVDGGPCAPEGAFCGGPCDPCSFCNVLVCRGGRWGRLEAPPPPPGTCADCDPRRAVCATPPPVCAGRGQVPSVRGGCWGECVSFDRCVAIGCDPSGTVRCPTGTTCNRETRRCALP